jgi:hypothetical protein
LGRIQKVEPFPAGEVILAQDSIRQLSNTHEKSASLAVILDTPGDIGEKSVSIQVTADCLTGLLSADRVVAFDDVEQKGKAIDLRIYSPAIRIDTSNAVGVALSAMCVPPGWLLIGKINADTRLPAGWLVLGPVQRADNQRKSASVIVNFDVPSGKGELSYVAQASANCDTGRVTLEREETYSGLSQTGDQVQAASLALWNGVPEADSGLHYVSLIVCRGFGEGAIAASSDHSAPGDAIRSAESVPPEQRR